MSFNFENKKIHARLLLSYKSADQPEKARFGPITLKLISVENLAKTMNYIPQSTSKESFDMTQGHHAKKIRLTEFFDIPKILGPIFTVILLHN